VFSTKHLNLKNMKNKEIGKIGEDIAVEYLIKKGMSIIIRNYREKFGEIDIVARSRDNTILFIEVKTKSLNNRVLADLDSLKPEDNFTSQKYIIVNRMASFFSLKYPELVDEEKGWRIDLIAIDVDARGRYNLRHFENV
jgi:putative endonuclease